MASSRNQRLSGGLKRGAKTAGYYYWILLVSMISVFLLYQAAFRSSEVKEEGAVAVQNEEAGTSRSPLFGFTLHSLEGEPVSMQQFVGKVLLIVNVASRCGYTQSNYIALQNLYSKYQQQGFQVLAFPCNQFGKQEPEAPHVIRAFVSEKFHVTFPIFEKIDVNGPNEHPLYAALKQQFPGDVQWNFEKFLIARDGTVVQRFGSSWTSDIEQRVASLL